MLNGERGLSRHFVSPTNEARRTRQWAAIAPQLQRRQGLRRYIAAPALGIVAGLLVIGVWKMGTSDEPSTRMSVLMVDGTQIRLSATGRMAAGDLSAGQSQLELVHGQLDVLRPQSASGLLTVHVANYKVVVAGAVFTLDASEDHEMIQLQVRAGEVSVKRGDGVDVRVVKAGESWNAAPVKADAHAPSPTISVPEIAKPSSIHRRVHRKIAQPRLVAVSHLASPPSALAAAAVTLTSPPATTAAELFELAQTARIAGHANQAERALSDLLLSYPNDRRAGLAAFDLGRLRMDALRDLPGALAAFNHAAALGLGEPFAEHIHARRVLIYDQLHNREACESATTAYLLRYPQGSHSRAVKDACP